MRLFASPQREELDFLALVTLTHLKLQMDNRDSLWNASARISRHEHSKRSRLLGTGVPQWIPGFRFDGCGRDAMRHGIGSEIE